MIGYTESQLHVCESILVLPSAVNAQRLIRISLNMKDWFQSWVNLIPLLFGIALVLFISTDRRILDSKRDWNLGPFCVYGLSQWVPLTEPIHRMIPVKPWSDRDVTRSWQICLSSGVNQLWVTGSLDQRHQHMATHRHYMSVSLRVQTF